ncbi:signal recognition particle-docking protein FtsY [Paraburkholderia kururiensis]|uniref:signal recognition particle-docking protein FtsY n=1 Tax=Paraburkholderia kururiensis TaxID=984307 RepID=UPI0005AA08C0|nr:signal recognition particle-docking protein FtsY [Paraburkholderia kururiensis]
MFSFFKRFRGSKAAEGTPADAQAETPAEVQSEPAQQPAAVVETTPQQEAAARATPGAAPAPSAREPEAAPPQQRPAADVAAPAPAPVSAQPVVMAPVVAAAPVTTAPAVASSSAAATPASPAQAAAPQAAYAAQTGQADDEAAETVEIVPPPAPEPEAKKSWLSRLRSGLSKTSSNIAGIFVATRIDEELYEELETALLMSDAGVEATEFLLESLREKVRTGRLTDAQQVKTALRGLLVDLLKPLEKSLVLGRAQPLVMMIAGVNGAGKTTSIGKLAKHLQRFDQSVLLAAGDTFRAAAREQLAIWGERNNVTVVAQESGDPAAVIFDAVGAARARKIDVLMADTAGRLPTQLHLMEELRKVKRVIGKALDGAPHEVLLVIDANTGQNALAQVKAFDDTLGLTGLIVTKLDGTAKGGILAAIARQRPVPVYFIGVGEKVEDLQPFSAEEFADALLGT